MGFDYSKLNDNPSPFYRVTIKAFVFDDQNRLLMGSGDNGASWEPPGGGWEHDESIMDCLSREIKEELGVELESIGEIICFYKGVNKRGFHAIKIAVKAKLESLDFKFGDMKEARFVTKDELLALLMSTDEGGIKNCVDQIWPSA